MSLCSFYYFSLIFLLILPYNSVPLSGCPLQYLPSQISCSQYVNLALCILFQYNHDDIIKKIWNIPNLYKKTFPSKSEVENLVIISVYSYTQSETNQSSVMQLLQAPAIFHNTLSIFDVDTFVNSQSFHISSTFKYPVHIVKIRRGSKNICSRVPDLPTPKLLQGKEAC